VRWRAIAIGGDIQLSQATQIFATQSWALCAHDERSLNLALVVTPAVQHRSETAFFN
jgi:hypothetical protein